MQILGKTACKREGEENSIGTEEGIASANNVGYARKGDGAGEVGQGVGQGDPVDRVQVIKLDADGVDAGGYDGGVDDGEEEAETDTGWSVSVGEEP